MSIYSFFSSKGGQGTSTTAAGFALLLSENPDNKVLIIDLSESQDLDGVLGTMGRQIKPNLDLVMKPEWTDDQIWALLADNYGYTQWVIDWGTRRPALHEKQHLTEIGKRFFVTKACYLSLRRYIKQAYEADALVLITEENRALRAPDVEAAAARKVEVNLPYDPQIARTVDAGLMAARLPRSLRTLEALLPASSSVVTAE
jgi:hypothetical protein